ncbi:MAG: hypothetical protein ACMG57_05705 [Candidatus Dojkabacteria bacterium]
MNEKKLTQDQMEAIILDVENIIDDVVFPLDGEQIEDKGRFVIKKLRNLIVGYSAIPILGVVSVPMVNSFIDPRLSSNNHDFYYNGSLIILGALISTLIFVLSNQIAIDNPTNLKKLVVNALRGGELTYSQIDIDPLTARFVNRYFKIASFFNGKRWDASLEQ